MRRLIDFCSTMLATCFFLTYPVAQWAKKSGRSKTGAGLVGSLAGLITFSVLPHSFLRGTLVLIGAFLISVVISDRAEELLGQKDDQRIVIDEWIGFWISAAFFPAKPVFLILAFILFRVLDTWKPFGIGRLGNLPGGWGVVMDDVAAGLCVNAILRFLPLS